MLINCFHDNLWFFIGTKSQNQFVKKSLNTGIQTIFDSKPQKNLESTETAQAASYYKNVETDSGIRKSLKSRFLLKDSTKIHKNVDTGKRLIV